MYNILGVIYIVTFLVLIIGTVLLRRIGGTNIFVLGKKDKREVYFGLGYLILLYIIFSNAITLPMPHIMNRFFGDNDSIKIIGVVFCCLGIGGYVICTMSFWQSVRIGVDYENAGKLTTTGIYAITRNPMYMSFLLLFFG
ncbi:MAG: hypothetical protein FWG10_12970 [Eubacteriaceae bacterium]|nr:hypothetical protein [Eubacteriaceae bacterium]